MTETRPRLRDYVLLLLFALALLAPGISSVPPVDRDESRYAVATTQMLKTGDFIDPRFQEQPRYLQPVGAYWLQSAAVAALSSPEAEAIWAYRLPSLIAALSAVLLTGWLGGRLFGRAAGVGAAVMLAACLSLGFEARIAKTDAPLLLAVTAAQLALARLYLDEAAKRRWAALFWAAVGCGFLIKGPIILLVAGSTAVALTLWDRKAGLLKRLRPLWGLPLALLIAAPWYVAIGYATDGLFYDIALGDNLMRKVSTGEQAHGAPPGYHLAVFALAFWPGSLFAALAAPWVWRERRRPEVRFLVAWIVPAWLIFEFVSTKLPHYVLPTYPAIACLAAAALFAPDQPRAGRLARVLGVIFAGLWLVASLALAALGPGALAQFEGVFDPLAITLGAAGAALAVAALWFVHRRMPERALGAAALAALVVWGNTWANTLPRLDSFWISPRIIETIDRVRPCPQGSLATSPYHEPSLVFLHDDGRTLLARSAAEAADALAADRVCGLALLARESEPEFLARAAAVGLPVRRVAEVKGRNYSDGDDEVLGIYAAGTP